MSQISDKGVELIGQFEGLVLHPYLDSVHVPTIGYGTTFYPSGHSVTMQDSPITKEQAAEYLKHYVNTLAIPAIDKGVKIILNQNKIDALCSFIYNIGVAGFLGSTLLKKINAGAECSDIQAEFNKWTKAGGKTLDALVKRRRQEAQLFCS